ncbi:hypothetical protein SD457_11015 [Coprobacillaceae bacterium CR2/5/TPMF4]|nr:hypothetical protein SD457_11015 [Coprobacillaceae bacterium CR2/5/TPMF4]
MIRQTKMLDAEEVKEDLGIGTRQLSVFMELKILNPIFLGKGWKFSQEEILEFQRKFRGERMSNYEEAVNALEKRKIAVAPTTTN